MSNSLNAKNQSEHKKSPNFHHNGNMALVNVSFGENVLLNDNQSSGEESKEERLDNKKESNI